jgi:hypothetical protein
MSGKVPDIDLSTSVRAKELRFGKVPKGRLWFEGEPDHESRSQIELENIPEQPEADVTYREVKVDWTVVSRIVHPVDEAEDEAADR